MDADPPAKVPPMVVHLKYDAKAVLLKGRSYSPPQEDFRRAKTDEMLHLGLIKRNNQSEWAPAPLIVPKSGPEQFRFTVDLRSVNSQTVTFPWPMAHFKTVVSEITGDTTFATIDLFHGYWQIPLDESSQECQIFITPDGVFTPTSLLQGQTNVSCTEVTE